MDCSRGMVFDVPGWSTGPSGTVAGHKVLIGRGPGQNIAYVSWFLMPQDRILYTYHGLRKAALCRIVVALVSLCDTIKEPPAKYTFVCSWFSGWLGLSFFSTPTA